MLTANIKN